MRARPAGFTLIEVLVTVAFLALGTLLIQEGFLRSAGLYGRHVNTLRAMLWADRKLWEGREGVQFAEEPAVGDQGGTFLGGGKTFTWRSSARQVERDLFSVRIDVEWREGPRDLSLTREIYATRAKKGV